jgi:hypothetical protein
MPAVACPCCRKRLRVPDHLAGRKVTCPRCDEVIRVPVELPEPLAETPAPVPVSTAPEEEALPLSVRLGLVALMLGLGSILILCLPVLGGCVSISMSVLGMLVALYGLHQARADGSGMLSHAHPAGGAGIQGFFTRTLHYPLAAVGVCFLALILSLLPKFVR